jgi:hypothetical protein
LYNKVESFPYQVAISDKNFIEPMIMSLLFALVKATLSLLQFSSKIFLIESRF